MSGLYKIGAKSIAICIIAVSSIGCAQEPPAAPVATKTVSVTATDFCEIMRAIAPPSGKLTWSRNDTPDTITGIRRLDAAVDKRCASQPPPPS